MKKLSITDRVVSSPEVLGGKPRINGTRISVELIMQKINSGYKVNDILKEYPGDISEEDVKACITYAKNHKVKSKKSKSRVA